MVESRSRYGGSLTFYDAVTWNYPRVFTNRNYPDILLSEFYVTIPGTPEVVPNVCFKLELNKDPSLGFCIYKYLLDKEASGSVYAYPYGGGMTKKCQALLSDIIYVQTKNGKIETDEYRNALVSVSPTPSTTPENNKRRHNVQGKTGKTETSVYWSSPTKDPHPLLQLEKKHSSNKYTYMCDKDSKVKPYMRCTLKQLETELLKV